MTSRWAFLRRLIAYYAECLHHDGVPSVRLAPGGNERTWARLRTVDWGALADPARPFVPALDEAAAGLPRLAAVSQHQGLVVGHPLAVIDDGRRGRWAVPVFLQMLATERGFLRADGPVLVNPAWLEARFATHDERLACCERLGIIPAEGASTAVPVTLPELAQRLAAAFPGEQRGGEALDWSPGLSACPVLAMVAHRDYHRGLQLELRRIARASDEDLERTALAHLFPHDGAAPAAAPAIPVPALLTLLDEYQRAALAAGLSRPLTVITGPPGTGKSEVVRHLLLNQALAGRSALLASRNHRALDAVVPPLNRLTDRGTLVIRTAGREARAPWQDAMAELLARPIHGGGDGWAACRARLDASLQARAQAEADLDRWRSLRQRHDELLAAVQARRGELPLHLRTADLSALPDPDQLDAWLTPWEREQDATWLARLSGGRDELRRHLAALPDPWSGRPLGDPLALQAAQRSDAAAVWRLAARAGAAQRELAALIALLAALPANDGARDLLAAHERAQTTARACLDRLAAGTATPLPEDLRLDLANLRAGLANLGAERFAGAAARLLPAVLHAFPLWACTNLSAQSTLPLVPGAFDLLVLDEASQCDLPGIIPLLYRCRRAVIAGDPRQLRHVSRLSPLAEHGLLARHGLTDLAVQRFSHRVNSAWDLAATVAEPILLAEHHRCHGDIAALASRTFYQGALRVRTRDDALRPPPGGPGIQWVEVPSSLQAATTGASAPAEVAAILRDLLALQAGAWQGTIGIATPFRAQVQALNQALHAQLDRGFIERTRLLASTAHGFQGDERDLICFSLCVGADLPPGASRFLAATPNLVNVAITRARACLRLYGDRPWMRDCDLPHLRALALAGLGAAAGDQVEDPPDHHESPYEARFAAALREAGLDPVPQLVVGGRRLDLALVADGRKVDVEIDGAQWHRADIWRLDDDRWRDAQLAAQGWTVLRLWTFELERDLAACVARAVAAIKG